MSRPEAPLPGTTPALEVRHLGKSFDALVVASDISLSLASGDRVALIGPNGAGKTTFVDMVSGFQTPSSGAIHLRGKDVTSLSGLQRSRRGLVRTFQISRVFRRLSVRENLCLAVLQRLGLADRFFASVGGMPQVEAEVAALLDEFALGPIASRQVGEIAYGQQRLLDLALALALKPQVLLLDEPAAGVPQAESHRIIEALDRLPADLAVLLIEHDMDLVFKFAHRVAVLAGGVLVAQGTPSEIVLDDRVRAAYLGSYGHARSGA